MTAKGADSVPSQRTKIPQTVLTVYSEKEKRITLQCEGAGRVQKSDDGLVHEDEQVNLGEKRMMAVPERSGR